MKVAFWCLCLIHPLSIIILSITLPPSLTPRRTTHYYHYSSVSSCPVPCSSYLTMVSSMRANTEGRKQENRNPHCVQRVYCVPPSPVSSTLSIPVQCSPHPRWGRANINPPSSTTHWSHCHVSPPLRWKCSRILALTILLNSVWRGICGENVRIAIKNFRLINPESGKIFDSVLSQQQPALWLTFTMRRRMIYTLTEKLPFLLLQSLHCIYEYLYIDIENKEYPYKRK